MSIGKHGVPVGDPVVAADGGGRHERAQRRQKRVGPGPGGGDHHGRADPAGAGRHAGDPAAPRQDPVDGHARGDRGAKGPRGARVRGGERVGIDEPVVDGKRALADQAGAEPGQALLDGFPRRVLHP